MPCAEDLRASILIDAHSPYLAWHHPAFTAVAARGTYEDWLREVSALVKSMYPEQVHLLDRLRGEDQVISVFVNFVVSHPTIDDSLKEGQ